MQDYATMREAMVEGQVRPADVSGIAVISAMRSLPREVFVPDALRPLAYAGAHLPIGPGRVILDPRTLAKMLDALDIQGNELVLDIGVAFGYSSAVIARTAEAVVAIEPDAAMAADAERLLLDHQVDNVAVLHAALDAGAPQHAPYDVIVLQGGVQRIPQTVLDQLNEGGRIGAIFMAGEIGAFRIGFKVDGRVSWRFMFNATAPVLPGFETAQGFKF
jgi:protein-L-isoaspartate(D-aspartate) O-methyltransferase